MNIVNMLKNKNNNSKLKVISFLLINILFIDSYLLSVYKIGILFFIAEFIEDSIPNSIFRFIVEMFICMLYILFLVTMKFLSLIIFYRQEFRSDKKTLIYKFFQLLKDNNIFKIFFLAIIYLPYLIANIDYCIRVGNPFTKDLFSLSMFNFLGYMYLSAVPSYLLLFAYWFFEKKIDAFLGMFTKKKLTK